MIKVKTTFTVTTDQLEVFCDPPLTFEGIGNIGPGLWGELMQWRDRKYPPSEAVMFVPKLFVSVSQNGDTYSLTTPEEAEALKAAVGDDFLADLVENYWSYEFDFFKKKRNGSANSLKESEGINKSEPTP